MTKVNASLKVENPAATMNVSPRPKINPPIIAPGILPIPPRTTATKHFNPGSEPLNGFTDIRSVKYRIEPTPARREPIANVALITLFNYTPISFTVSKSVATARIAIPIFV